MYYRIKQPFIIWRVAGKILGSLYQHASAGDASAHMISLFHARQVKELRNIPVNEVVLLIIIRNLTTDLGRFQCHTYHGKLH